MTAKDIIVAMQTDSSNYYYKGSTIKPVGIVVHSTGANNPTARRYVNAPTQLGANPNGNWFGSPKGAGGDPSALPHGVIGLGKDDTSVVVCQILPWTAHCQGCGSGRYGSYNKLNDGTGYIQFEICEDGLTDANYFNKAFDKAAEFCAYLTQLYPDIKIENIVSHKEACARGYASNHGDPENWLSKFGKNMNWFRDKVKGYVKTGSVASKAVKTFTPRLTAPSTTDKHWINTSHGGLNDCIHIGGGSVLPNCVGYAFGRFFELIGEKPKLSKGNAEDWYGNTSDGYKRSATPELGAVACWRKGQVGNESDGCGHVAIVEEIKPNGDIVCSNSAYGGSRFYMQTFSKSAGYNSGALIFQGFILPPVQLKSTTATSVANTGSSAAAFKVGDIVNFTGSTHYTGSTATRGTACKSGKAKITSIANGAAHPYHLVNDGGGCTVYGWVNAEDVQPATAKTVDEIALEVIRGEWGNGDERKKRLTEAGYDYDEVQARVKELKM